MSWHSALSTRLRSCAQMKSPHGTYPACGVLCALSAISPVDLALLFFIISGFFRTPKKEKWRPSGMWQLMWQLKEHTFRCEFQKNRQAINKPAQTSFPAHRARIHADVKAKNTAPHIAPQPSCSYAQLASSSQVCFPTSAALTHNNVAWAI